MSFYDDFPPFRLRDRTNNLVDDFRNEFENSRNNMWGDNFGNFFTPRHGDLRSRMAQHRPEFFQTPKPPTAAAAAGAAASGSPGPSEFSGERVIPIHICTDEDTNGRSASSAYAPGNGEAAAHANSSSAAASSDSPKSYAPQRNNTTEIPRVKEISRNQRAQSAPPSGSSGINMTHCGGGQSKKGGSNAGREIPIQIEIKSSNGQPGGPKTGGIPHANKNTVPNKGVNGGQDTNKPVEQESKPTPPKKPLVLDPMDKIKAVAEQVRELAEKVSVFNKNCSEKDYLYLDEMLTRCLIHLDDVEVEGKDDLRQARREVIKSIQKCISDLEVKAGKQPMNTDVSENGVGPMVEDNSAAGDATNVPAANPNESTSEKNVSNPDANETKECPSKVNEVESMAVDQDEAAMNGGGDQVTSNTSNQEKSANMNTSTDPKAETPQQPPVEKKEEEVGKTEDKKSEAATASQEPEKMET